MRNSAVLPRLCLTQGDLLIARRESKVRNPPHRTGQACLQEQASS